MILFPGQFHIDILQIPILRSDAVKKSAVHPDMFQRFNWNGLKLVKLVSSKAVSEKMGDGSFHPVDQVAILVPLSSMTTACLMLDL